MGMFDFFKKGGYINTPESLYNRAKLIAQTFTQFPSFIDPSLHKDNVIMKHATLINSPKITTDERKKHQEELKKMVFGLLDQCLLLDNDYAPAILLYARVANWNISTTDRQNLISIYEKFSSKVDQITKGSKAYGLIEKDIECFGSGNYFDKVERHLADFYYEHGSLYLQERQLEEAIKKFKKAEALMPFIYAGSIGDAYSKIGDFENALSALEEALKLPIKKTEKDFIKQHYQNIKSAIEESKKHLKEVLMVVEKNQGILQKDIYSKLEHIPREIISSILRSLDKKGLLTRKKKGSTYQLVLEKPIAEIIGAVKYIHY